MSGIFAGHVRTALDSEALINLLAPRRNAMFFFTVVLLECLSKHVRLLGDASHNVTVLSGAPLWQSEVKRQTIALRNLSTFSGARKTEAQLKCCV